MLTAGHCTFGTGLDGVATTDDGGWGGNDVWVSFEEVPDYTGIGAAPFIPDDNAGRYAHYRDTLNANDTWIRGTAYPHPEFDNDAFYLHDAGVVILDEPFVPEVAAGAPTHAVLPALNYLDQFTRRAKSQTLFEAVGYGLEYSRPKVAAGRRHPDEEPAGDRQPQRRVRRPRPLVDRVLEQQRPAASGRHLLRRLRRPVPAWTTRTSQVAVNSYGVPPNCTGGDGAYRIDQQDDLDWLGSVLAGEPPREDAG